MISSVQLSRSTGHGARNRQHRSFIHDAPAVILAVTVIAGCLAGGHAGKRSAPGISAAGAFISLMAVLSPTPFSLGAAGFALGSAIEATRRSGPVPNYGTEGVSLTLRGRVGRIRPFLHGQNSLTVNVQEVLGRDRLKVRFPIRLNLPEHEGLVQGQQVILRAVLRKTGSDAGRQIPAGRVRSGGWISRPALSITAAGRSRLAAVVREFPDSSAAGLLAAITLGERWRVDARTRDILRRTGTYHLLAISGVHVGAAALPFLFLARLAPLLFRRVQPRTLHAALLVLCAFAIGNYLSLTGTSAPALRAAVYFVTAGVAAVLYRSACAPVGLSWCVWVIVCFSRGRQPDLSLVLSALAVTGILSSSRRQRTGGVGPAVRRMFSMTLGAVLFTLPVSVWLAGGIPVSVLAGNVLAAVSFGLFLIPAAVLADGMALLTDLPLRMVLSLWLRAGEGALGLLAGLADVPLSFLVLSPTGCATASIAAAAGILFWQRGGFNFGRGVAIFVSISILSGAAHSLGQWTGKDDLTIHFPRVGQADAAIIRHGGRTVLIDCGPRGIPGQDGGAARALQGLGISKVDAVFLSHLHPDHSGGLADIAARWKVGELYLPRQFRQELEEGGWLSPDLPPIPVRYLSSGDVLRSHSAVFTVLGPGGAEEIWNDRNRLSLRLYVEAKGFSALFTGDAGWDQVLKSLRGIRDLDLLKIPHHGSRGGFPPPGLSGELNRLAKPGGLLVLCPSPLPRPGRLPAQEVVSYFEKRGLGPLYSGDRGVNISYKGIGSDGNGSTVVDNHHRF